MPHIRNRYLGLPSGQKNFTSDKSRNILVVLSSPRLRDFILSSTHRFNEAHSKDMLNSKHIDIADDSRRIYITKHLSHECKQLHDPARKNIKGNNYVRTTVDLLCQL
ncbi:hypothetical protein EVAR_48763_1 [Eumeta japonica]|uniref:Uncharacterized protein n=1 Tax=Eumeta variegata TaxID=151549 RepID=A0A4C1Y1H0_EUMVA|nr:hypothetical protein EVAR_48763_1 [Eumeta japonica]